MEEATFNNLVAIIDLMTDLLDRTSGIIKEERAALLNLNLDEVERLGGTKKTILVELIDLRTRFKAGVEDAGWVFQDGDDQRQMGGAMWASIANLPEKQRIKLSKRYGTMLLMSSQAAFDNRVNLAMTRGGQGLMEKTLKVIADAAAPPKATYSRPGMYGAHSAVQANRISSAA